MIIDSPIISGSFAASGSLNQFGNVVISGSLTVTGSIIGTASFATTASFIASASNAATASYVLTAQTASYVLNAQSASYVLTAQTASFVALAQSASNAVSAQTASFANAFTVAGNLTAQTLVVQTITSSIDFVTGSTRFGTLLTNTHVFSGSVSMNPRGLFASSSGLVGIGTTNPRFYTLHVVNSGSNAQIGVSNQGTADGDRQLRMGFGGNGANTWAELQGTRLNVADDVNIALQPGGGSVGIGTTSPTSTLEVQLNQNAQTGIRVRNSTSGTSAGVEFGAYTNSGNGGFGKYSTGNTPYKNIVAGSTYIYNGASGDISLLNDASGGNISFAAGGASTAQMIITSTGNVGINKTNPDANSTLDVNGQTFVARLALYNDNGTPSLGTSPLLYSPASATLAISTGATERMRITSGGRIGMFTSSPSGSANTNLLHIDGQGSALRVGPCFPAMNGSTDRDFLEILPGGVTTTILAPNEVFLLSNPGGGAGSWSIDVIAGSGGVRLTNGATSWASISDIRQKDIIEPITDAISKISTLSTVIYKFKDDETEQRRVGLIAQEVNEVLPEVVNSFEDEEKMWSVRYTEVIPLLTKAIQELNTKLDAANAEIEILKNR